MPHISATNGSSRVLQSDIPPPSIDLEHHPTPLPPSLTSAPPESMEQNHKSFWLFKRGNQNRSGPRNFASSKRGAPLLERSLSEPNSPTEPTNSKAASRDNVGEKPNYIATALELLEGSKVRFDGHKKEFAEFNYRYHQLFANGQPIHGKIVKLKTPKPNAQDVAKLLVRDIQARLEELDRELESLEPEDSSTSSRASASKRGNSRKTRSQTPEQIIGPPPRPWYNPSTVNPVVLDKIDRRRSINPEGTWHGHSRNRSAGPLRPLIDFSLYENRNGTAPKLDVQAPLNDSRDIVRTEGGQIRNKDKVFDRWNDNSGERERERKARAGERDRERDRGHHRDGSRTGERTPGPPQDTDRGRRDRHRHLRDNIPPLDYPSREEYTRRERQMSDPVVYTQRSRRRQNSPESIAPAMYTLAEDVEVRGGSSTTSVENMAGIGIHRVPRVPTVVAYPDPDEEDFELNRRNGQWNEPASAPPQTTTFTVPDTGAVVGPIRTGNETTHRRRRRSRSLGYELDGRANMSRPRSKSPRDRLRGRDRERPRERERDDREREKGKERERDRDKERERDRPRDKDRDRDRDRERERDKGKERERDRDRNKDRDRDRDRDREREKDKYASSRSKYNEVERERQDSGGRRDREREKDRDKTRDRERDREKDKPRDKDRKKDRDRERDKERNKDRERDYDYNQREPNGSSSVGPTTHLPTNMPGAFGPLPAGPSPGLTPPPPHTMLKFGVATNGPCPPNPNSESRFMEILTSPMPPIHFNLPGP